MVPLYSRSTQAHAYCLNFDTKSCAVDGPHDGGEHMADPVAEHVPYWAFAPLWMSHIAGTQAGLAGVMLNETARSAIQLSDLGIGTYKAALSCHSVPELARIEMAYWFGATRIALETGQRLTLIGAERDETDLCCLPIE